MPESERALQRRTPMQCEVCGNEYKDSFTVSLRDETYAFDCFECAIHALAPTCAHCGCKVIGHGLSREGDIFCCEHCVRMSLSGRVGEDEDDEDIDEDDEDGDYEVDDLDEELDEAPGQRRR
jgi:hypothetical protein